MRSELVKLKAVYWISKFSGPGMIAVGKPTSMIATDLHIHHRTVETHRASICRKLQLSGANSLLRFALEHKSELLT
jgi:DNA-binding NarL/FixJ family response regulator